jgi:hypothetical protein
MSLGRGLQLFGPPKDPGGDADIPEGDEDTALADDMAHLSLEPSTAELAEQLTGSQSYNLPALDIPSEISIDNVLSGVEARIESSPAVEPSATELATANVEEPTIEESTTEKLPAPTTEREYRDQKGMSTVSILPVGTNSWDFLLANDRYAKYLPLLCEHYVEIVRAKEKGTVLYECENWPEAEGLDFDGFINWVWRCRQVDVGFT